MSAANVSPGGTPFTVGIPVFNEEAILVPNTERLLAFLDSLGREYEVIMHEAFYEYSHLVRLRLRDGRP